MKITPELLKRYAQGACTEAEKQFVENWLPSDRDITTGLSKHKVEDAIAEMWGEIKADTEKGQSASTISLYEKVTRYAVASIILFTVGFFTYQHSIGVFSDGFEEVVSIKTINTQRGEKRTVTLSDGSTIRMNYETEIRVPEKFEENERVIYLIGHAHFDIARDTQRPFLVYTGDSKTQVLGTSFDINTKEDGETEIIVTSGKVAFSGKDQADNLVKLTLNDRAVLGADKNIIVDEVDALALTAWKDNRLVFDGETLQEIIEVLEPWYDVQITIENLEILSQDFKFSKNNPSLDEVLDRLGFLGNFNYKIDGNQVVLF